MSKNTSIGVTLIELLVCVAIITVLAAVSIPSLAEVSEHLRLKQATQAIYSNLQVARSLALKHSTDISISFQSDSNGWCYGFSDRTPLTACNCFESDQCQVHGESYVFTQNNNDSVQLLQSRFAGSGSYLAFSAEQGIASAAGSARNGTVWLSNRQQEQTAIVISRLGRLRTCTTTENNCPQP